MLRIPVFKWENMHKFAIAKEIWDTLTVNLICDLE
uniref:Uncharacterized protein n=1 Tax=Rhizophora mucronata TaxID=61149 RepID=A0A2P2P8H7_RHIMU